MCQQVDPVQSFVASPEAQIPSRKLDNVRGQSLPQRNPLHVRDRWIALALVLVGLATHLWTLDAKGLAYDEAATSLMSRASLVEIIRFHWTAAFEHLPVWIVFMRGWSQLAGQSEFALRLPSVFAFVATVPLLWALLRKVQPNDLGWRTLTLLMLVLSPVLLLYAQEARMYALVVMLGVTSVFLLLEYLSRPRWYLLVGVVLVNGVMLGLQYYSVLLVVAQGCFVVLVLLQARFTRGQDAIQPTRKVLWFALGGLTLSLFPLVLWMAYSPGFHETIEVVLRTASATQLSALTFLHDVWLDLSFGAIRWQPDYARIGLLLAPLLLVGTFGAFHSRREDGHLPAGSIYDRWPLLFSLLVLVPVVVSTLLFRTLATRYILYVAPFISSLVGYGIVLIWRYNRPVGALVVTMTIAIAATGLVYYFGPYTKSEYREMSSYLQRNYRPDRDTVLIEAPRQHILAKYYLGEEFPLQPVPDVALPDYWPLTAPTIVPDQVDDIVQSALNTSSDIWVILSAEAVVDPGEFLTKYLTAVAFQHDCHGWLDVRVCRFINPDSIERGLTVDINASYANGLLLDQAQLALDGSRSTPEFIPLLVSLDWLAEESPTLDSKVSVRVVSSDGRIVTQADQLPIGPLLPPTTWQKGDRKPGFSVIHVPTDLDSGTYSVQLEVYDPETALPVPMQTDLSMIGSTVQELGQLEINDTIRLLPAARPAGHSPNP